MEVVSFLMAVMWYKVILMEAVCIVLTITIRMMQVDPEALLYYLIN